MNTADKPKQKDEPVLEARPTIVFSPYSNTFSGWGPKLASGALDTLRHMN